MPKPHTSDAPVYPKSIHSARERLVFDLGYAEGHRAGVKAARERPAYGRPPFGKRWRGGQLIDVDSEIGIIVAIVEMRERGVRWADVVEALNAEGPNPRSGKAWTKRSAENIHKKWGCVQGAQPRGLSPQTIRAEK